jgi:hypothetical protein
MPQTTRDALEVYALFEVVNVVVSSEATMGLTRRHLLTSGIDGWAQSCLPPGLLDASGRNVVVALVWHDAVTKARSRYSVLRLASCLDCCMLVVVVIVVVVAVVSFGLVRFGLLCVSWLWHDLQCTCILAPSPPSSFAS